MMGQDDEDPSNLKAFSKPGHAYCDIDWVPSD